MGAHLHCIGNDPEMWSEALDKLQNAAHLAPGDEQLFSRLRISYDARGPAEKGMFLDIAFFFLGRSADAAKRAWLGYAPLCVCTVVPFSQSSLRLLLPCASTKTVSAPACRCSDPLLRHAFLPVGQNMGI